MPGHHLGASSSFQISQPAALPLKCLAALLMKLTYCVTSGAAPLLPATTKTGLTPMPASWLTGPSNSVGLFEL